MSQSIRILALDPAMRNVGMALMDVSHDGSSVNLVAVELIKTENDAGKTVRKSSDDLRRAKEIFQKIETFGAGGFQMIVAEIPSGSQSSRASLGSGMMIGMMAALSFKYPLIEVSPSEAKRIVTGRSTGTKDEMMAWAHKRWPDVAWITKRRLGIISLTDDNEHMADACAIGVAGTKTEAFRSALSISRMMSEATAFVG